jgi:hypothetical protein
MGGKTAVKMRFGTWRTVDLGLDEAIAVLE